MTTLGQDKDCRKKCRNKVEWGRINHVGKTGNNCLVYEKWRLNLKWNPEPKELTKKT